MAASPMQMPTLTATPASSPVSGLSSPGSTGFGGAPQLYPGGTNSTGMQMPLASSAAPNGLTVSPNPGSTSTPGAVGTNTGTLSGITGSDASRVLGENQKYLGQGIGALATNYLQTGAGYNGPLAQQTINATDAAMQQQINTQYGDLQTSLGNAGLSPNSSASALAQSNFLSNASAQENEVAANQYTQMYSQSQQDYLSELQALQGINNAGTMGQTTVAGEISAGITGGLPGLAQYNAPAAGQAGQVTAPSAASVSALANIF